MRRALVFLLSWFCAVAASAASVTLHPNGNLVVFEGMIEIGDFDKVEKLSREASPTGIYLASPGGNLSEALRIGALVRSLAWETKSAEGRDVPPPLRDGVALSFGVKDPAHNNLCTSACFFIFAAGIYRNGHGIGMHRPFMAPGEVERLPEAVVTRVSDRVRFVVEVYLRRMGVPLRYVDEMYAVPSERMRWLTDDEIETDFRGFVPSVRDWVRTQCGEDIETLACKDTVMQGIKIRAIERNTAASAAPSN